MIAASVAVMARRWTNGPLQDSTGIETAPIEATDSCPGAASCPSEIDFSLLHAPCRITQGLQDVLALQVRIVGEDLVDGPARTDLPDDHADRDSPSANARLSTHDQWV